MKLLGKLLFMLLPLALSSQTITGTLDNRFTLSGNDSISVNDLVQLNIKGEHDFASGLNFTIRGYGRFNVNPSVDKDALAADLEQMSLSGKFQQDSIQIKLGRTRFSDRTGLILNHKLDGFQESVLINQRFRIKTAVGYSGLLLDQTSTMIKTVSEYNQDSLWTNPRIIWQIDSGWESPEGNSLYLGMLGQFSQESTGGNYETWYANTGGTMALKDWVFQLHYALNGGSTPLLIGTEYVSQDILAHLVLGGIGFYPESLRELGIRISLNGLYTSGDGYDIRASALPGSVSSQPNGSSNLFTPISKTTLGSIMGALPGNLIRISLNGSITPVKGSFDRNILDLSLKGTAFLRPVHGPVNVNGINEYSQRPYLGTEIESQVNFRPFSDLGIQLRVAALLPENSAGGPFEGSRDSLEWESSLLVSLAF